jgi:hypothetical protein
MLTENWKECCAGSISGACMTLGDLTIPKRCRSRQVTESGPRHVTEFQFCEDFWNT